MIRAHFKQILDNFYSRIHVNDFSSFIKSDFRDDLLFDLSPQRAELNKDHCQKLLAQINQWRSHDAPSPDELILLAAAEDFCHYIIRNSDFYWYKFNLTHNTSPLPYVIKRLESYPLPDAAALERYCHLIGQFPSCLGDMLEKLHQQSMRSISMPPEQCQICLSMLQSLEQNHNSLLLPHNRPQLNLSDIGYSQATRQKLQQILQDINRALQDIAAFIEGPYRPLSQIAKPGLCNVPGGQEYYQAQIITYTSYDLSPYRIHSLGYNALAETENKMNDIIAQLGLKLSIREFRRHLQTERICFDDSIASLQARFDKTLAEIKPHMSKYFLRQPQAGCRSEALPPSREATTSWGYYSVPIGSEKEGVFYFSGAELDKRTQIRTAAIVAHELLPGHHYQTNLILEDKSLPDLSRHHFNTAFADGWAEYAADLVQEMGIYDLYDLFGRYVWDMVLCCRLVVDTGLNILGWTIKEARSFMANYTFLTDQEIFTETLRYGVDMPGQALAYKFGSMKMQQFRQQAQKALGARFDIRNYHEQVLRYGSLPLNLLEQVVENYIAANLEKK